MNVVTNVYFYPDNHSDKVDLFKVIGEPKYRYYVKVESIEKFLIEYLCRINKYPIYFTITTYDDYDGITALLTKLKQEYHLKRLGGDITYTSTADGGWVACHMLIIKAKITNTEALQSIISSTLWLAATNCFCTYILSFSDNISFTIEKAVDWNGEDIEHSTILIDMNEKTTTIGISYDAHGFYLFSNLDEYGSIDNISKQLQNYKVVVKE